MSLKPIIKSAREALDKKDYTYALQLCSDALEFEPDNYWLLVFKAVALGAQGDTSKALTEYFKATKAPFDNPTLAFQGIINLYESKNLEFDEKYHSALESLSSLLIKQKEYEKHYALIRKRINLYKEAKEINEAVKLLHWLASEEASNFYPSEKISISKKQIWKEQFDLLSPLETSNIAKDIESGRMRLNSSDPLDRLIDRVQVQNYSRELTEIIRNLSEVDPDNYLDLLMKRLLIIVLSDFCPSEELRVEYAEELKRNMNRCEALKCLKYNLKTDIENENENEDCEGPNKILKELNAAAEREEFELVLELIQVLEKSLKKWNRAFKLEYFDNYTKIGEKLKLRALIGLNYQDDSLLLASKFSNDDLIEPLLFEPILTVLESSKQFSKAVDLIELKLIAFDPEEPSLILRLVNNLIEVQRFDEASEYLEAIPQAYPKMDSNSEAKLYFATGLCSWYQNKRTTQVTLSNFLSAAKSNPLESKYFTWIGKFYWRIEGERDRALKCFTKALNLDPNNLEAGIIFAEASLADGLSDPDCSVILMLLKPFTKLSIQARNRRLVYYYGIALFKTGSFIEASVALQSALKGSLHYEDSSDPPISDENCLQWIGDSFLRSNRIGSAEKAFNRLAAINPESVVAQIGLAAVHLKSNNPIEAVDSLDNISIDIPDILKLKVKVEKAQALLSLARHYLTQGRFISAMRATSKSLQSAYPFQSPEALRLASEALTLSHSYKNIQGFKENDFSCFVDYSDRLEINSGLNEIVQNITSEHVLIVASVKYSLSSLSEAFKDPLNNCLAPHWLQLAISLSKGSSSQEFAISASENCIKSKDATPNLRAQAHHLLALLQFKDQACKRKVQHHLIKSLQLQPDAPQTWTDLGRFYLLSGDWDLATEAFKRALAVDQEDLMAAFELARSSGTVEGSAAALQVAQRAFSTQPVLFNEEFALCLANSAYTGDLNSYRLSQYAQIYLNRLYNRNNDYADKIDLEIPNFATKSELLEFLNSHSDPLIWSSSISSEFDCEFLMNRPLNEVTQSGWRAVVEGLLPSGGQDQRTRAEVKELLS